MASTMRCNHQLHHYCLRALAAVCGLALCWYLGSRLDVSAEGGNRLAIAYKNIRPAAPLQSIESLAPMRTISTATAKPPKPSDAHTNLSITRAIIAATLKRDNTSWLGEHFQDWERSIYVMDDPKAPLTVVINKGNEGSAYLSYIIDRYSSLPDLMVFIHARRYQWHNEDMMYDHVPVLHNLRTEHVNKAGYASLRCTWKPGCPVNLRPDVHKKDSIFSYEEAYAKVWEKFWPGIPIPTEVGAPCCAQFAVSKTQVLKQPVQHYEMIRHWLWNNDLGSFKSGRIMEYMWHVIFGQSAVACEDASQCFYEKFGHCNLTCHSVEACKDRYWPPWPMTPLPQHWPDEGQGVQGWPVDSWWVEKLRVEDGVAPAPPDGSPRGDGQESGSRGGPRR